MSIVLAGFRALVEKKAGEVQVKGTKTGFELHVAGSALHTEAGKVRVFKNLNTLARFAKAEGVNSFHADLSVVPKGPKTASKAAKPTTSRTPAKKSTRAAATA
jgi:hypothetical protein